MTFQAWKMKFLNFTTFQVFHDLYEPCTQRICVAIPVPDWSGTIYLWILLNMTIKFSTGKLDQVNLCNDFWAGHWGQGKNWPIAHVRYIKFLTWLRGFLVIFLYLVWFLCAPGNCETMEWWIFAILTLKPRSHVGILIYIKRGLLLTGASLVTIPVFVLRINQWVVLN